MADFVDKEALKDDLGITGTADDAWLDRRIAEFLSAASNYTHRYIGPIATFEDDFTRIVERGRLWIAPPYPADIRIAPYLRQPNVTAINTATKDGSAIDPAKVFYDARSGLLQSIDGAPAADVARQLVGSWLINYSAGFETLPADLYAAMQGVIANRYQLRKAGAGGLSIGGLGITDINVPDVGSIRLGGAASGFETQAGKASVDPLLGPWIKTLDPYYRPAFSDWGLPNHRMVPS